MSYQQKYLKYKEKYLELKNIFYQHGGTVPSLESIVSKNILNIFDTVTRDKFTIPIRRGFCKSYATFYSNLPQIFKIHFPFPGALTELNEILYYGKTEEIFTRFKQSNEENKKIIEFLLIDSINSDFFNVLQKIYYLYKLIKPILENDELTSIFSIFHHHSEINPILRYGDNIDIVILLTKRVVSGCYEILSNNTKGKNYLFYSIISHRRGPRLTLEEIINLDIVFSSMPYDYLEKYNHYKRQLDEMYTGSQIAHQRQANVELSESLKLMISQDIELSIELRDIKDDEFKKNLLFNFVEKIKYLRELLHHGFTKDEIIIIYKSKTENEIEKIIYLLKKYNFNKEIIIKISSFGIPDSILEKIQQINDLANGITVDEFSSLSFNEDKLNEILLFMREHNLSLLLSIYLLNNSSAREQIKNIKKLLEKNISEEKIINLLDRKLYEYLNRINKELNTGNSFDNIIKMINRETQMKKNSPKKKSPKRK